VGKSGDGGIDGLIKEDRLGLEVIDIQAKRWEGAVGRPEVQKCAGALQGQQARKGRFLTTSSFTKEAVAFAAAIDSKMVLMGGEALVALMIDHNIGVAPVAAYEIKRVDTDDCPGESEAPASHQAVEPTAYSVRSSLASASGGGSPRAFGIEG
jgi:restriction system protein